MKFTTKYFILLFSIFLSQNLFAQYTTNGSASQDAEDFVFLHDEEVFAIDLDLGAAPLAEEDAVAGLDVERDAFAVVLRLAVPGGDDLALLRLLLGGVGNDDATSGLRLGIDSLDDNAVVKRSEFHAYPPTVLSKSLADLET